MGGCTCSYVLSGVGMSRGGGGGHVDKRAVCILLECFLVEMNSP